MFPPQYGPKQDLRFPMKANVVLHDGRECRVVTAYGEDTYGVVDLADPSRRSFPVHYTEVARMEGQ